MPCIKPPASICFHRVDTLEFRDASFESHWFKDGLVVSIRYGHFLVGILTLTHSSAVSAQVACDKCEKIIVLNQARWACLLDRLDKLSEQRTPIVFFTLNEQNCPASRQVVVPKGDSAPRTKAYYQLSQKQVQCLKRIQSKIPGPDYRVDFAAMCGR